MFEPFMTLMRMENSLTGFTLQMIMDWTLGTGRPKSFFYTKLKRMTTARWCGWLKKPQLQNFDKKLTFQLVGR